MSEIPADIMKIAIKVGETALRNLDQDDVSFEVGIIARALMARDERAARIAEEAPIVSFDEDALVKKIATAIRTQSEK